MLELQRLALRYELQIVVTTHSPEVINTVPRKAESFLREPLTM
jgi:predicted ATP-binding protein involved in virulence